MIYFGMFRIREAGIDVFTVGLGATPTSNKFSTALHGLTELHPGNFIFYGINLKNFWAN